MTFIDEPLYNGAVCNGFADDGGDNLFSDPNLSSDQPGLMNAIDDITETFQGGNIDGLVTIVNPNSSVAVYERGSYQYSLAANNYLDMARDAIASMHTVSFTLNVLHQRGPDVFSVAGKQVYQDQNGNDQVEWVSFVLQDISGIWTLTQVGTAPAHYQAPALD